MKAFLTGSRAYGAPRPDSDVDMVLLADENVITLLRAVCDAGWLDQENQYDANHSPGKSTGGSFKFGKLNIIAFSDEDRFMAWKIATGNLIRRDVPVDRMDARTEIRRVLSLVAGLEYE